MLRVNFTVDSWGLKINHDTVTLVQKSFKGVVPIAEQVGASFYARLFEPHSEVRSMFAKDIRPQARKLVRMLAVVVNSLHRLPAIQAEVAALARSAYRRRRRADVVKFRHTSGSNLPAKSRAGSIARTSFIRTNFKETNQ